MSLRCNVGLALVSKKFMELANKNIAYVNNKDRFVYDSQQQVVVLDIAGIWKVAKHLVFLDLSFTENIDYSSSEVNSMILGFKPTLRALTLRSTGVADDFLSSVLTHLTGLRYLNVSQRTADRTLVTDIGARCLTTLRNMKWLNLSTTSIAGETLMELQQSMPQLEHLEVTGCSQLNNSSLLAVRQWKLQILDISNCPLISIDGLALLCDPRYLLSVFIC